MIVGSWIWMLIIFSYFNGFYALCSIGKDAASQERNILVLPLDMIDFDRHEEAAQTVMRHFGQVRYFRKVTM